MRRTPNVHDFCRWSAVDGRIRSRNTNTCRRLCNLDWLLSEQMKGRWGTPTIQATNLPIVMMVGKLGGTNGDLTDATQSTSTRDRDVLGL